MKANGWTNNDKFDYTGVTTEAPPPPEEGLYKAKITLAAPQPTKEGKPMLKLTVELFENGSGEALTPRRKITDNLVLSQAALFRVKIVSEALDIEPLADSSLESAEQFCRDIVTASKSGVWVKVKHEPYTDKTGNERVAARIDRYMSDAKVAEESKASTSNGAAAGGAPMRRPRGKGSDATTVS
jgi:hypothetical protein